MLSNHGYVNFIEVDFKRYVGAQIGIYNPQGEKVGAISHLRNKEVLFIVGPDRALVEGVFDGGEEFKSWPLLDTTRLTT